MSNMDLEKIGKLLTKPALYEQLAEEASELAQSALKVSRILRNENKTPISLHDAERSLTEEYTDVTLCADVLKLRQNDDIYNYKLDRWIARNTI